MENFLDQLREHYSNETLQRAVIWVGPAIILLITLLREGYIALRYSRSRFRAERLRIVKHHAGWVTAYFFLLLLVTAFAALKTSETPPFNWVGMTLLITWIGAALGAGILALVLRSARKKVIDTFIPECPGCHCAMEDISAVKLATYNPQQQAEIQAGGTKLEAWRCHVCSNEHVYFKKWFEAATCPKCRWRTLRRWTNILQQATSTRPGRVRISLSCKNAACGYSKVRERMISPRRRGK